MAFNAGYSLDGPHKAHGLRDIVRVAQPGAHTPMPKLAPLRLLDRVADQRVQLLRLRGEGLHLLLGKPRLKG